MTTPIQTSRPAKIEIPVTFLPSKNSDPTVRMREFIRIVHIEAMRFDVETAGFVRDRQTGKLSNFSLIEDNDSSSQMKIINDSNKRLANVLADSEDTLQETLTAARAGITAAATHAEFIECVMDLATFFKADQDAEDSDHQ